MKINNDLVVFDLETTDEDEHRIIEIGAVLLDRELNPINEFSSLVALPPGVLLSPRVVEITGITSEDLAARTDTFSQVASAWLRWTEKHVNNPRRIRLCAWGNYFDINVLRQEYTRNGMNYPWSGTCFDVKTVAAVWCALSGRGTDSLGLQKVAEAMHIEPAGRWHRALIDARATAMILKRSMNDLATSVWLPEKNGSRRRVELKEVPNA